MPTSLLHLSNHAYETSDKLHRKANRASKRGEKTSWDSHEHSDAYEEEKMHRQDAHDYHRIALHLDNGRHGAARRIYRNMDTAAREYAPAALARHLSGVNEDVADSILSEGFHSTAFADTAAATLIRSHASRQKKISHSNALHDLADHIDNGSYKQASKKHSQIDPSVLSGLPHVVKQHLARVGISEMFAYQSAHDPEVWVDPANKISFGKDHESGKHFVQDHKANHMYLLDKHKDALHVARTLAPLSGVHRHTFHKASNKAIKNISDLPEPHKTSPLHYEEYIAEGIFDAKEVAKELIKRHGKNVTAKHVEDFRNEMDEPHKLNKLEVLHHLATMRHK